MLLVTTLAQQLGAQDVTDPISPFATAIIGLGGWGFCILMLVFRRFRTAGEMDEAVAFQIKRYEDTKEALDIERRRADLQETSLRDLKASAEVMAKFIEALRSKAQ